MFDLYYFCKLCEFGNISITVVLKVLEGPRRTRYWAWSVPELQETCIWQMFCILSGPGRAQPIRPRGLFQRGKLFQKGGGGQRHWGEMDVNLAIRHLINNDNNAD